MQSNNSCSPATIVEEAEVAGFIMKAFQILSVQEYQKIIYWASNGLEFVIKDIPKLEQIVLPHYFRHNKINSFVRQLNMYGFHKIKHNNFKSTFKHEYFQKGRQDLLTFIRRKPKLNEKQAEENQYPPAKTVLPTINKPILPPVVKQQDQYPILNEKWSDITQQFLVTTKMINLSLVKMSFTELPQADNLFGGGNEDEEASIEDELEDKMKQNTTLAVFQNPTMFLAWQFD